jgi:tRNA1Val (adenine37-N6)-methyltransferase
MKVCTDACLFGAYAASKFIQRVDEKNRFLDIGSGTGLLSLMLAQKSAVHIDAVEIDEDAYMQSRKNFELSPFNQRLHAFHSDILHYNPPEKYQFIICNPPFFVNDLKSRDPKKNAAKHDSTLHLQPLALTIGKLLDNGGFFTLLLPFQQASIFEEIAVATGFYLTEKVLLKHSSNHPYSRCFLLFSNKISKPILKELIIKKLEGKYTEEIIELMKDYYLHI